MFSIQLMTPVVWLTRLLVGAYPQWHGSAPTRKQRIYFANHSSHLDTVVLWSSLPKALRGKTRPVAAKDYWTKGFIRRRLALKELRVVLVDRHSSSGRVDPLAPLREALENGDSLIIFPEGTRRPQPLPGEFKSGLWRLMREFPDVELIPVYIENLHRAMPKGCLIPIPTICSVHFGAPLEHTAKDTKDDFLERARHSIVQLADR